MRIGVHSMVGIWGLNNINILCYNKTIYIALNNIYMTAIIKGVDIIASIKEIQFIPRIGESICFWYNDNIVTKEIKDVVYFIASYDIMHRVEIYV